MGDVIWLADRLRGPRRALTLDEDIARLRRVLARLGGKDGTDG